MHKLHLQQLSWQCIYLSLAHGLNFIMVGLFPQVYTKPFALPSSCIVRICVIFVHFFPQEWSLQDYRCEITFLGCRMHMEQYIENCWLYKNHWMFIAIDATFHEQILFTSVINCTISIFNWKIHCGIGIINLIIGLKFKHI